MADIKQGSVVGIFANRVKAEEAIAALQKAGFQNDQIRLYIGKDRTSGPLTGLKNIFSADQKTSDAMVHELLRIGVAAEDTSFYRWEYESGCPLVTVETGKNLEQATTLLKEHGGYGPTKPRRASAYSEQASSLRVGETAASREAMGAQSTGETRDRQRERDYQQEQHMHLHAEHLMAQKETKQVGEVVLRKRIISNQESIDVPLTHEEVVVERYALGEAPTTETIEDGQVIRMPVSKEEACLARQVVTTGDIVIGKRVVPEMQHFSDTVRHEEAYLEHEGDIPIWDNAESQQSPPHPAP